MVGHLDPEDRIPKRRKDLFYLRLRSKRASETVRIENMLHSRSNSCIETTSYLALVPIDITLATLTLPYSPALPAPEKGRRTSFLLTPRDTRGSVRSRTRCTSDASGSQDS